MSATKYVPLPQTAATAAADERSAIAAKRPADAQRRHQPAAAAAAAASGMQRCPYLHEMRERLLGDTAAPTATHHQQQTQTLPPLIQINSPPSLSKQHPAVVTTPPTQAASPVRSVHAKFTTTPTAEKAVFGDATDFCAAHQRANSPATMSPGMDRRYTHQDGAHQVGTAPIGTVVKVQGGGGRCVRHNWRKPVDCWD